LGINAQGPNFQGDYRYIADVNLKSNHKHRMLNVARPKTIEFRFFQSPKTIDAFFKNMEFVIALINFVKSSKLTLDDFAWGSACKVYFDKNGTPYDEEKGYDIIVSNFCKYVKAHKETYDNLYRFLAQKKLLKK